MRASAGGGNTWRIAGLLCQTLDAIDKYQELHGHGLPGYLVLRALDPDVSFRRKDPESYTEQRLAEINKEKDTNRSESVRASCVKAIVNRALQVRASKLIGQSTQATLAERRMHDEIRDLEDIRNKTRFGWGS